MNTDLYFGWGSLVKMKSLIFFLSIISYCTSAQQLKNVLFFAIDDLRPELGAYGHDYIKSPHIDDLASKSILFERAYCQVAVCSPSRTSLLTGRRADSNHVWRNADDEYWRTVPDATNATTIPQYFKENGYLTIGMGKIFHPGPANGKSDVEYSWSPESLPYSHISENDSEADDMSWHIFDVPDSELVDGKLTETAISFLQNIKQNRSNGDTRPFFVAVGFHKPHLAWYCPKKYYDMYPTTEDIKLAENPDAPEGMPPIAYSTWRSGYKDLKEALENHTNCNSKHIDIITNKECAFNDTLARKLKRAYYSCVSYTDAQVGRVVQELETQGFADDTIIVLWGDHGWQLGEHNIWSKFTNFEDGTHVPFMIRVPGITDNGMKTKALVELIDIFPSLTELTGLDVPPMCTENSAKSIACVEGSSVAPLLKNPDQQWKKGAFSQFARPYSGMVEIPGHPPFDRNQHDENVMGYTIRTDKYRFTEWYTFDRNTSKPDFNAKWGTELYDHSTPTISFNDENVNLADKPEMESTVNELRKALHDGWRAALPPTV